ncbi:DUF305 domain-containing protein [Herbaspirillum rhizosphaerae]|uniref:DUF305 domain-containing protein n=2 Tax=Herbaspirillum rhizosphaerae TaxID=346179 RepID=A0ABW8Z8P4_9BURK
MQTTLTAVNRFVRPHRHVAAAAVIAGSVVMAAVFLCTSGNAIAQEMQDMQGMQGMHHHHGAEPAAATTTAKDAPPVFIASTAKPFSGLMDDAMAVMDHGMTHAPMNDNAEHDFITMMMPHHQGAVDMAKAVLLYSDDPEIRNLALGIITEQQNEIRVMQAWLQRHADKTGKSDKTNK